MLPTSILQDCDFMSIACTEPLWLLRTLTQWHSSVASTFAGSVPEPTARVQYTTAFCSMHSVANQQRPPAAHAILHAGRTSVLPEVPEDQPAADEPLLSDDEPAAAAAPSGRAGRQRQSAPAASADTEARGTSGRGRRRTIGAAAAGADAVTTPRSTRRSSRHSQS